MSNEIEDGLPFLFYLALLFEGRYETSEITTLCNRSIIDIITSHFESKKGKKNRKKTKTKGKQMNEKHN